MKLFAIASVASVLASFLVPLGAGSNNNEGHRCLDGPSTSVRPENPETAISSGNQNRFDLSQTEPSNKAVGSSSEAVLPDPPEKRPAGEEETFNTTKPDADNAALPTTDDLTSLPPLSTPIVYRYYKRMKRRTRASGSVPLILIGSNLEHWNMAAKRLAKRGFNAMVICPENKLSIDDLKREGPSLILQLIDALQWEKTVLVASDSESALAIEAAKRLAPSRVVGLVLCGDMTKGLDRSTQKLYWKHPFRLDEQLAVRLRCAFTIVWDGDLSNRRQPALSSTRNLQVDTHRSVIVGGGPSPHRKRPGLFSWTVARFVEEQVAPPVFAIRRAARNSLRAESKVDFSTGWRMNKVLAEETGVVVGRTVATVIFYGIAIKVLFYQYDNFRIGVNMLSDAKESLVALLRKHIIGFLSLLVTVKSGVSTVVSESSRTVGSANNTTAADNDTGDRKSDKPPGTRRRPLFFPDRRVA